MRNAFEDVEIEGLNLEIDASEQPRSATLERVWVDGPRVKAGRHRSTLKVLLRTYRGDEITKARDRSRFRPNARGSVSVMVADGVRLSQFESRELQVQPLQATAAAADDSRAQQRAQEQPPLRPARDPRRRRRGARASRWRHCPLRCWR